MEITSAPMLFLSAFDRDTQMLRIAETDVAVSRLSDGYPVICLHATGHDGEDFRPLALHPACAGIGLITLDWPGQGGSPPDQLGCPASSWRYAEILGEVIESLNLDRPPLLLANSIGGGAAIGLAASGRYRLAGLVLCNPSGLAPLDLTSRIAISVLARFFEAGAHGARWFPAMFGLYYRLVLPRARARRNIIAAHGAAHANVIAQAWRSFADPRTDRRQDLANLKIPVLFAWARDDQIVSFKRSRRAVEASQAEVILYRGGHAPFLEDIDAFAPDFAGFVRQFATEDANGSRQADDI